MTKQLLFALFAFFFTQTSYAQDLIWAKGFAWFSPHMSTTVDAEGNLYLAGIDLGNHDIDPGPAVWAIPGPSNKAVGFVAKFDPTGQPLWLRSVGAPDAGMLFTGPAATGNPGNHNIKIAPDGHVHVLFSIQNTTSGKLYIYPGQTDTINAFVSDVLLTFDPAGDFVFAELIFGNSTCRSTDFYAHPDGRVTVVGFFEGSIFPGSASRLRVSAGQTDGFIYQYNPFNYNVMETRSRRIGGPQKDYCYGIAGDPAGDLFVGGMFFGDCDVDPADDESFWLFLQNGQIHNGYLMKCDDDLDFQWAQRIQTGGNLPPRIETDAAGNGYISTHVTGGVQVYRYSPTGNLDNGYDLGENTLGASAFEHLQFRIDEVGNLHCWRPEPSATHDLYDAVYRKIDGETSELLSELRFPATKWSAGLSLTVDALDNVFLTGSFEGIIDLDPGPAEQPYAAVAPYPQRLFWVKLNEKCPTLGLKFLDVAPVGCDADGMARAVAFGGTAPYTFEWQTQPAQLDSVAQFTQSGYYTIQMTDSAGCVRRRQLWINGVPDNTPTLFDLETRPIFATEFRPGFSNSIFFSAANRGCNPVDGTVKIALDPALQYLSAQPQPDAIVGDTLIWLRPQWDFDSPLQVAIQTYLPAIAVLGNLIHLRAWSETPGEPSLFNNVQLLRDTIIGSYDPNDISAAPAGACAEQAILPTQKLTYSIRFQNTGTASAINVRILDTLPAGLDLNTLRVLAAGHAMAVERLDSSTLAFVFDNIHLPDSFSNEAASHGFVQFEIAQKPDVPLGTPINNRAAIYFDFNAPVITNSVFRTIADPLPECPEVISTAFLGKNTDFSIFPNPVPEDASPTITLENDYIGQVKVEILSLDGRMLNTFFLEKNERKVTRKLPGFPYLDRVPAIAWIVRVSDEQHVETKFLLKL